MVRNSYLIILLFLLIGCSKTKIERKYFVGTWKSSDNANIILNEDGTCVLKDLDYFIISSFPENKKLKLNSEGTWDVVNTESELNDGIEKGIKITYGLPNQAENGGITFYISGSGIQGNKPPLNLFIWNGDPDDMNKYEFIKK